MLKAPNKPMIEIKTLIRVRSTLRMDKSTPWYILKKNDCPDQLSWTNWSGGQMKPRLTYIRIFEREKYGKVNKHLVI